MPLMGNALNSEIMIFSNCMDLFGYLIQLMRFKGYHCTVENQAAQLF